MGPRGHRRARDGSRRRIVAKPVSDAALRRLARGSSFGNPPVDPIGVVRRHVMRVESSRIERSRRIAREFRHGQGAGRYGRWRRRDVRVNGPKAVDPIAMAYEKRRGGIMTFIVIWIIRRVYDPETNEKIGAALSIRIGDRRSYCCTRQCRTRPRSPTEWRESWTYEAQWSVETRREEYHRYRLGPPAPQ